jgi:hypothetical protein
MEPNDNEAICAQDCRRSIGLNVLTGGSQNIPPELRAVATQAK